MAWIRRPHRKFDLLKEQWESVLVIHLSCQTLGDQNQGYSPRITSIAVIHAASSTMHSFSIHLVAEINKVPRERIEDHYDELEKEMLEKFYEFLKNHQEYYWVHWNMRDINFGFEAIAHRYKVLTEKDAPTVSDERRICLPSLITSVYGPDYVSHPKMLHLMEMNGGVHRHVLTGKEEVVAFENKQFYKMHQSTMAKVYFFRNAIKKLILGRLKTKKSMLSYQVNQFMELPSVKIMSFIAVVFALIQLAFIALSYI